ncbi:hypothetical protein [Sorangium sp. So ce131]|uniref:hypothetical protein n=1 Tax=Sorangium sp. So ce131 TaxID=3133282 RepID=UPI003F5E1781
MWLTAGGAGVMAFGGIMLYPGIRALATGSDDVQAKAISFTAAGAAVLAAGTAMLIGGIHLMSAGKTRFSFVDPSALSLAF